MPASSKPDPQPANTYPMQQRSPEERKRLRLQDASALTLLGLIPDQEDPARFQQVLDVACGTGGWLIELAKTYPEIRHLVGVDISPFLLDYAREQAIEQQVADRVEFRQMDALGPLDFPTDSFDLVNQRFAMSYVRTWDWPRLLQKFQRVARPGGVVRLVEGDFPHAGSSPAHLQLCQLIVQAAHQAGRISSSERPGVSQDLARFLEQYTTSVRNIQTVFSMVEHRAGTSTGQSFIAEQELVFRTALPFLQKWTTLPADYETIYQQMVSEIHQPDFSASVTVVTVWGTKEESCMNSSSGQFERHDSLS